MVMLEVQWYELYPRNEFYHRRAEGGGAMGAITPPTLAQPKFFCVELICAVD